MIRTRSFVALACFATVLVSAAGIYMLRWPLMNAVLRREFRDVKRITTSELAAWLADDSRPAPLLLDTRTRAEYDVSHLRGANYAGRDTELDLRDIAHDRPIVTYCSIGYRSGKFARQLQASGYTNVQNLEGSIFAWANEDRPLCRDGLPVTEVHPFNETWSVFLQREHRARLTRG